MAREEDVCEVFYVDEEKVKKVRDNLIDSETAIGLAEIFKVLGDPTRVKLLHALSAEELCVCDVASLLGMTESAISHQLRVLRNLKLVKFRKEGKMVYYSLADEHIKKLLEMGVEHAEE
ncbi:MAG: ArsR/SmtB family transcription factor [Candidatus Hydrothermarchaeales archaeon]